MVSQLLYDLPATETYRILFMERDLDEMLASQEKMLARLGRPAAPRDQIRQSYQLHLDRLQHWLAAQPHMPILRVSYNDLVTRPAEEAARVCQFLSSALASTLDAADMLPAVDPSLYRNRG
jgi:hypothetical protein